MPIDVCRHPSFARDVYDEILLPVDGSAGTQRAIEQAIDLATMNGSSLHVLHVVDESVGIEYGMAEAVEALERAGQKAVDDVVRQAEEAGVERVEGTVTHGVPHRTILEYADEEGVDLIVVGTHGRTGFDRYLLGSVAEKVVRLAEVPVLTVRMRDDESSDRA